MRKKKVTNICILALIAVLCAVGAMIESNNDSSKSDVQTQKSHDEVQSPSTSSSSNKTSKNSKSAVKIEAGNDFYAILYNDGTVDCESRSYSDVVDIAASFDYLILVKSDGTVELDNVGASPFAPDFTGITNVKAASCNVDWESGTKYAFLKNDGTVEGYLSDFPDSNSWTDISQVDIARGDLLGLKSDGTVICAFSDEGGTSYSTTDIIQVASDSYKSFGLTKKGTVEELGGSTDSYLNSLSSWNDIISISGAEGCLLGLNKNGRVVQLASEYCDIDGIEAVCNWSNVVDIDVGTKYAVGVTAKGKVYTTENSDSE